MAKNKKQDSWVLDVEEDENGDAVIQFPPDLLARVGWQEGDTLKWRDLGDGTWSLSKSHTAVEDDSWDDIFKNGHRTKDQDHDKTCVTLTRDVIHQLSKLMEVTDLDSVDVVVSGASGIGPSVKIRFAGEIDATDYESW